MDGEVFTLQVSFVSFAVGTASTAAWVVLGMNDHALEGMLVWFISSLITLSLSRYFYNKHLLRK